MNRSFFRTFSRSRRGWIFAAAVVIAAAGLACVAVVRAYQPRHSAAADAAGLKYHTISPIDLVAIIRKPGELQAVVNLDITCPAEGRSTIQQIVPEGTRVKKGDVLIALDASDMLRMIEGFELELQQAELALVNANEEKELGQSQIEAREQTALVDLELAQAALREYIDGTYPQEVAEAKNMLDMARITLENKQVDLAQARRMFSKGFINIADLKTAEYDVVRARNDLAKHENALKVLTEYTYQKNIVEKKNAVAQAQSEVARTQMSNTFRMKRRVGDVYMAIDSLATQKLRLKRYREQVEACVIRSPADGMVIYPSQYLSGGGINPLMEGGQVYFQQLLLRLPDTSRMKAVVRVSESQVASLKIDPENPLRASVKITGLTAPVGASVTHVSVVPENQNRWMQPDLKEYPVELALDRTPPNLKPGTSVQAEIFLHRLEDVVAVPLNAVYSAGAETFVFVRTPDGPRPRRVDVGIANDTHLHVLEGVSNGDDVLLLEAGQGHQLLEQFAAKKNPPA